MKIYLNNNSNKQNINYVNKYKVNKFKTLNFIIAFILYIYIVV